MKRRVCESCLYFESAGFAKNGWCHHPSRRQNSDVRLMVRSNELGCRNGWNADLWVAAVPDGGGQRLQPDDPIGSRAASEVEPAQQSDLLTSIVAAKTDNVAPAREPQLPQAFTPRATVEEDIFVKQTPSLTWSNGPISAQPATELVQNPKAAILRARDQYRQRRKNEGRLADRQLIAPAMPLLASSREAAQLAERTALEPEPAPDEFDARYENRPLLRPQAPPVYENRRPVSPVSLQEIDRPFPSMTDFPEDRARFESVPQLDDEFGPAEAAEYVQDDTWIETRQLDTVPSEPYVIDELFEETELVTFDDQPLHEDEELSVRHRESILNRFLRQRRERRQTLHPADNSQEDVSPLVAGRTRSGEEAAPGDWTQQPVSASDLRSESEWSARPSSSIEDDFVLPPPLPEFKPAAASVRPDVTSTRYQPPAPSNWRGDPRAELRDTAGAVLIEDEFGDQPLFASSSGLALEQNYELGQTRDASIISEPVGNRVERICQTCRDFRPAENGERGWCNNKWAFNHRRMVDADDLACRNSLGSWWTPKDDVWRRDGDISRHAQQTPRVDQWLFGINPEAHGRRGSGS